MKVYCVIRDWWGEQPKFVSLANYDNDLRIFSTREAAEGFIKQDAHIAAHKFAEVEYRILENIIEG